MRNGSVAEVAGFPKDEIMKTSTLENSSNEGVFGPNYFLGVSPSYSQGKRPEDDESAKYL